MLNAEISQLRELDYTNSEIVTYFEFYDTIEEVKQAMMKDINEAIEAKENYTKGDMR
jgi:hypothetical protein